MSNLSIAAGFSGLAFIWRLAAFFALWLILAGADPGDLPAATIAVVAATWTSLRLLPPGRSRPSPAALAIFALRFVCQSIVAGMDIAIHCLDVGQPVAAHLAADERLFTRALGGHGDG